MSRVRANHIGVAAIIATGAAFVGFALKDLPLGTIDNPGPAVMPLMLGSLTILFALWSLTTGASGLIASSGDEDAADPGGLPHPARVIAAMVVAAIALGPLGYRLTILALLVFFLALVERKALVPALLVSFALSFGSHALFQNVLKLQLPAGPWGL
jgi:putative tricarboxylic transport membrane protein